MNCEQTNVSIINSILSIFLILFLQGCSTQFAAEENKVISNDWREDSAIIKYVYFPQNHLVPIPGWDQVTGVEATPVSQEVIQGAEEIAPRPTMPESWTVLFFPVTIQSGVPADQGGQENQQTIFPTIVTQTRTSNTSITTTSSTNDVHRTSGAERSEPVSSQSSDQNNSRNTGATRTSGR